MLTTLKLTNYIFIENLEIDFKSGMTVLTGETGSGKSLLIGALNLLLGGRLENSVVKKGAEFCEITAIFDDEIFITRRITSDGKSKCYLDGSLVPLATLKEKMTTLLDIHGQNMSQGIFNATEQLDILDHFSASTDLRENFNAVLTNKKNLENNLAKIIDEKNRLKDQKEFLKFQKDELEKLNLQLWEYDELEAKYKNLVDLDKLKKNISEISETTNKLQSDLAKLLKNIKNIPQYQNYFPELLATENVLSELERETAGFINLDAYEIDNIAERLENLKRAQKKYKMTNDEMVNYFKKISGLLTSFEDETEEEFKIKDEIKKLETELKISWDELSKKRRLGAVKLEAAINANFADLCMEKVAFKIEGTTFLIRTNPGQDFAELAKIVSGGELSRIMLAIKAVLSEFDKTPTLIFDEIDTGIGGKVAFVVGKKLKAISKKHQVLCITHLAQVAVFGENHKIVIKKAHENHTEIEVLDLQDKTQEIARMLGGENITETAVLHAKDLMGKTL